MPNTTGNEVAPEYKARIRAGISFHRIQKEIVLDLVNLTPQNCERFRRRYLTFTLKLADSTILQFRDDLRNFWSGDNLRRFSSLHYWLKEASMQPHPLWNVGTFSDNTYGVSPDYQNLPLSIAIAASDLSTKMTVCANPDCPQKYFVRDRKTQRFCDRQACAAYGQRQHKLKWWNDHKKELLEKRRGKKIRPGKERGKG